MCVGVGDRESVRVVLGVKVDDTPVALGDPEGVLLEVLVLVVERERVAVEDEVCVGEDEIFITMSDNDPVTGSTGATATTNAPTVSTSIST